MAENIPNVPAGAVPPKKETGKVQPKKETVRINLPPKPSAAPTIKLPTLPPGGPSVGTGAAPVPAAAPAPAPAAHAAPVAAPRPSAAAPVSSRSATTSQTRPAPAPVVVRADSPMDSVLAIAALVVGVLAVGTTVWMMLL